MENITEGFLTVLGTVLFCTAILVLFYETELLWQLLEEISSVSEGIVRYIK